MALFYSKKRIAEYLKLDTLMGATKVEVIQLLGLSFNDIHSNVWRFTLPFDKHPFLSYKYMHLYFEDNNVARIKVSRFK